ncbi:hypothetical protein HYH03_011746 [Edaphochlamys debaryana]|uniref:Carbonic anhydrase n=1 Tax=Edaphochlamys debaryana TaxID=47281 RepID=A0A835XRF6_9CHLO|nr:hypothetical protein HYH03_011746 [Edaphochlamys debaryana]|eukprot:KAG2489797.1 hypothetical protein HYH03_011746 [Edaphochlamys debaryana]
MRRDSALSLGLLAVLALGAIACTQACIWKFGTAPDSLAKPSGGTHWDHGFNGDDWEGMDASNNSWVCMTGKRQSPINIPYTNVLDGKGSKVQHKHQTRWNYPSLVSNGSNVEVINTGHTIQVEWLYQYPADVKIAAPVGPTDTTPVTAVLGMHPEDCAMWVDAVPAQFHFHAVSEHLVSGKYYPLEMHIVHKITNGLPACAAGCFSVTGILFELHNGDDNPLLEAIWAAMPERAGVINYLPEGAEIPLGDLLPKTRDYVAYEGSLTTPPCTEGLLWHVFTKVQKISRRQWNMYRRAVGLKECTSTAEANTTTAAAAASHSHSRRMLGEVARRQLDTPAGTDPNAYTCKVVGYGDNHRNFQSNNGRVIKLARAD